MSPSRRTSCLLVDGLTVHIEGRCILNQASLSIEPGKITALVGESGSGKSTLARSIMGVLPGNAQAQGRIMLDDANLLSASAVQARKIRTAALSLIFQDPVNSMDPLQRIGSKLSESIQQSYPKMNAEERRLLSVELLQQVRLKQPERRLASYPHQLSGGECQRIAIADALSKAPRFLIADEPTTALDIPTQEEVLLLLKTIARNRNIGLLLITHNLEIVREYADHVYVMQAGQVVEQGGTVALWHRPQHPYTQSLVLSGEAVPVPRNENSAVLLKVESLGLDFRVPSLWGKTEAKPMLRDISFTLHKGECLGVIGGSGAGKSTLGLALLKVLPAWGTVWFREQSILKMREREFRRIRRHMQIVFQNPFSSFNPRILVGNSVSEGLAVYERVSAKERDDAVAEIFSEVGLSEGLRHRYPHELSGGELQRAAIARALLLKPELVILDEPTSSLDHAIQFQIIDLLQKLQKKYALAYLFISHDLKLARRMCSQILQLENGRVLRKGATADILSAAGSLAK